ncbi:TPA: UGMP family protein, partial [Candidatus Micrarchaeota archaeon]|nr:UGMP family protein [Candidatus Micrarchaeota archaeon]
MIVLGIESTAHTFGVGIVDERGRILADQRAQYRPEEGGIRPREAA